MNVSHGLIICFHYFKFYLPVLGDLQLFSAKICFRGWMLICISQLPFYLQFSEHSGVVSLHEILKSENDKDLYLVLDHMDTDLGEIFLQEYVFMSLFLHEKVHFRRPGILPTRVFHYLLLLSSFSAESSVFNFCFQNF